MSRVRLVSLEDMTAEERAQYDRFPSNLPRALLLVDRRLAQAPPELANALRAAELEPRLREAAILQVEALGGSAYVWMRHLQQARRTGLSDEDISTLEAGEPPPGWRGAGPC